MKKIFLFLFIVIALVFIFPILFTLKFDNVKCGSEGCKTEEKSENQDFINSNNKQNLNEQNNLINIQNETAYDYKQYSNISLLNSQTNEITQVSLDEYLYGVVSAEMPANFELEALKAQAIVARTYTIYTISHNSEKHGAGTICTASTCCQAWISKEDRMNRWEEAERESNWNKIVEAVNSTKGKIIVYNGEVIDAFFHANSGGKTESPVNVWGGTNYPYLVAVETAGEDGYTQYSSEVEFAKKDFEKIMKEKYSDFSINWNAEDSIKIIEHTDGNRVKTIKIGNKNISGVEARALFSLKSANFIFSINGDKIKFSVIGYGHGVGMSQTGADSMAKSGSSYEDIIKHFYNGVEIINFN